MNGAQKSIFISHCTSDKSVLDKLTPLLNTVIDTACVHIFNTYNTDSDTTEAGEVLDDRLRNELHSADVMLAVMTDDYVRSPICLAELSSFWCMSKKVIPIVFNGERGAGLLKSIFYNTIIYLDVQAVSAADNAKSLVNFLSNNGYPLRVPATQAIAAFTDFFAGVMPAPPSRGFIGSTDEEMAFIRYAQSMGIRQFTNASLSVDYVSSRLRGSKEVFIAATTGANLISALSSSLFEELLLDGADITVLFADRESAFCSDVALIERIDNPETADDNLERLSEGFMTNMRLLRECAQRAAKRADAPIGHIYVGSAFTLIRQTVVLGVDSSNVWGFLSFTMPPSRANYHTPSVEFMSNGNENDFASLALHHVKGIQRVAAYRKAIFEITPDSELMTAFSGEKGSTLPVSEARRYWEEAYKRAERLDALRLKNGNGELIEIAAMHPLRDGLYPAEEFEARLRFAYDLYLRLRQEGKTSKLYIPGSVHRVGDTVDKISLSKAGENFLLSLGADAEDILGEEENAFYKGDAGVYNSADECFVAASLYRDYGFTRLHCVCSPNQMMRKKLFFMAFGVLPRFYTVPCDKLAHGDIYEIFEALPDVLLNDHTWQDSDSKEGRRTRAERDPRLM